MATFQSIYPWYPTQNDANVQVFNKAVVVTGQMQKQAGIRSFPPTVTSPGTIVSAGTVANGTGYDCLVYASATTGIQGVKVVTYNGPVSSTLAPAGTLPAGATGSFLVPGPGAIIVTYTGTLTWVWQAV